MRTSDFAAMLSSHGVKRAFIAFRNGKVEASHACLESLRASLEGDLVDYNQHECVFLQVYGDCLFGVTLWRTRRGQGCGGIRLREYESLDGFINDGLRLSIGMGRKNALANLWWGGGKGVIAIGDDKDTVNFPERRSDLLHAYGAFITSLRGCYVAAEDAGMNVSDMDQVFQTTRFTTCINPDKGGSGNPSIPTATGIVCGMEGALSALGLGTLEGKSVAVQGLGNVGGALVGFLLHKGCTVIGTDIDLKRIKFLKDLHKSFVVSEKLILEPEWTSILSQDVDIVSPCAFGGVLNDESVPLIKARIVCGAANNQLLNPSTDYGMQAKGIFFCPDFVVNRMGIVNCANEQYGRIGDPGSVSDPIVSVHLGREDENSIFNIIKAIIMKSIELERTTADVAEEMANRKAMELHPIFGHRSHLIIESLINDGWATEDSKT